mmetsp:Transcript_17304/g.22032  ORF Transcript_17304/g.22032 Transcript_17304/m.22032 type:complete len:97 (+) Transcript_17304:235-525(+)
MYFADKPDVSLPLLTTEPDTNSVWNFEQVSITRASSLPILPSQSWDNASFPDHTPSHKPPVATDVSSITRDLLDKWDPALDEYLCNLQASEESQAN